MLLEKQLLNEYNIVFYAYDSMLCKYFLLKKCDFSQNLRLTNTQLKI